MDSHREAVCPYCLASIADWWAWCPSCGQILENSSARIPQRRGARASTQAVAIGMMSCAVLVVGAMTASPAGGTLIALAIAIASTYGAIRIKSRL